LQEITSNTLHELKTELVFEYYEQAVISFTVRKLLDSQINVLLNAETEAASVAEVSP